MNHPECHILTHTSFRQSTHKFSPLIQFATFYWVKNRRAPLLGMFLITHDAVLFKQHVTNGSVYAADRKQYNLDHFDLGRNNCYLQTETQMLRFWGTLYVDEDTLNTKDYLNRLAFGADLQLTLFGRQMHIRNVTIGE